MSLISKKRQGYTFLVKIQILHPALSTQNPCSNPQFAMLHLKPDQAIERVRNEKELAENVHAETMRQLELDPMKVTARHFVNAQKTLILSQVFHGPVGCFGI